MIWKVLIFVLLSQRFSWETVAGAKILAFYPFDSYSHFKAFQPLLEELLRKGHKLTLLSSMPLNDEFLKNYTHISLENCENLRLTGSVSEFSEKAVPAFLHETKFHIDVCENIIKCPVVQEIIHSNNYYDLIIGELFLGTDIFFALGKKFNAPVISTTTFRMLSHHSWILGNPDPPHLLNTLMKVTHSTSLVTRALNFGFQLCTILLYEFYCLPRYQTMAEKYFSFEKENIPNMKEIMKNISVSLVNSHYSLAYVKPDLPNVVNVAGIHFTRPKPLPAHLQKFMDEAEHGVVYLSLGSILDTGSLHQLGLTLIHILKILPQRIIIKWDGKLSPHGSKNIFIGDWFSQPDILNHPNCRLFITHGGCFSLLESLNASVPVIGIPFFGDQHFNLGMVEHFGLGNLVELNNVPSELPGKIEEVLMNPKYVKLVHRYKNNMQKRSLLFQNRLTSPLDTAMYWVDHVLKHKDTSYLKPASIRLTWYEFYSLDVFGILLILTGSVFYALKFILGKLVFLVLVLTTKIRTWLTMKPRLRLSKTNLKTD